MRWIAPVALAAYLMLPAPAGARSDASDGLYADYARLLAAHVRGARVDYAGLVADRGRLTSVARTFGAVPAADERGWTREERLAFWINAYNAFTLDAVAARYPIQNRAFSFAPRNSIRQIAGVWTTLTWPAAGRVVTLDGIEHGIIRKEFGEPLIHFAVNCASVSCPPLRREPYEARILMQQLEDSTRQYLASPEGVRIDGDRLKVTSLFKWYGGDFVPRYGSGAAARTEVERAILDVVARYGPPDAASLARRPGVRIDYLPYNWALNDTRTN